MSASVLAVVSTLAVVATSNARRAERAQAEADRQKGLAQANAADARREASAANDQRTVAQTQKREADRQRDVAKSAEGSATAARNAEAKSAAELRVALGLQRSLRGRADAAAQEATAQKTIAQRNATEAMVQRNLALATNRKLEGELYESTLQSIGSTWERDPGEIAGLVASVAGRKGKGWEWGYWHRVSKVAYAIPNDPWGRSKAVLAPTEGAACLVYDEASAQKIDPSTGKILRDLWHLPPAHAGRNYVFPTFSRNGRWAIRDDGRGSLVLQDLARGMVRPLPSVPVGNAALGIGVSDDGRRCATVIYATTQLGESAKSPERLIVWDVPSGRALATRTLAAPFPYCFGLSPDGGTALLDYEDDAKGLVGVADWDVDKDRIGMVYTLPKSGDSSILKVTATFGPDGSRIVGCGSKIAVFNVGQSEPRLVLNVQSPYPTASVSPDGRLLVTSDGMSVIGLDGQANQSQIWDFRSGALIS